MIYLFENPNNNASVVYDETTLTEQQKLNGVAVEQLPHKEEIEGKMAVLKVRKSTEEVWWEHVDKPKDENAEIENLKTRLELAEQALIDLYMGGM